MPLNFSQRQAPLYGPRAGVGRQNLLAQKLLQQGSSTAPVQSPVEGLARALTAGLGGYTATLADRQDKRLDQARNATLAQALQAGMGKPAERVGPVAFNAQPGSMERMAAILAGNPETAGLGFEVGMGQVGRQQELADALALQDAKLRGQAPKVQSFFDETGREQKRQWNPATSQWETVGGTKTDILSPEAEAQKARISAAGRSQTNVTTNVDTTEDAFGKEFGKQNAAQFFERRQGALDAVSSLKATQEAKRLLDSGIISGTGATFIVEAGKALRQMGFDVAADDIANTEAFVATRAQEVGRIIKLFGAGTGLSDADREFAQKAAAGKIEMTEPSIRRIIDINERASRNVIELFNKDASAIDPEMSPYPLTVDLPQAAPSTPTSGGADQYSQEDLEYTAKQHGITVEEVKKRLGAQ